MQTLLTPLPPKQLCRESPVASKSSSHGRNRGKSFFDRVALLLPDETIALAFQGQQVSRLIFPLSVSVPRQGPKAGNGVRDGAAFSHFY